MGSEAKAQVLALTLEQLRARYATRAPQERVEVDGASIGCTTWVAETLVRFASGEPSDVDLLVTKGVAVMLKSKLDLGKMHSAEETRELFAVQGEVMLDVAVGTALVREVQRHIDGLLAAGEVSESRDLSAFHHELRNTVLKTRKSIGESERERALAMAEELEGGAPAEPQAEGEGRPAASKRRERQVPVMVTPRVPLAQSRKSLIGPLAVVFLVLIGVAWYLQEDAGREIASEQAVKAPGAVMEARGEITRVQDRHPHVVLTVDPDFWQARAESERLRWLQDLARDARSGGYKGLVVREESGQPLAEWVVGNQPRLMPTAR